MCAKVNYVAVTKFRKGLLFPLLTREVLEYNKGERVAKTNVWVKIKRSRKYLQGFEDNFK